MHDEIIILRFIKRGDCESELVVFKRAGLANGAANRSL